MGDDWNGSVLRNPTSEAGDEPQERRAPQAGWRAWAGRTFSSVSAGPDHCLDEWSQPPRIQLLSPTH